MVAALVCGPPCRSEPEDQACCGDETRKYRGAPGFVCCCASLVQGFVHSLLGFRLRDTGTLRHELRKVRPIWFCH